MEKNVKVARAHRALAWFYAVLGIMMVAALGVSDAGFNAAGVLLVASIIGAAFALHYFVAKGAMEKKRWAKNTSRGVAVLMLFGFPVGTLIGIYLLVNSSNWTE